MKIKISTDLDIIHKIKECKEPPYDKDDPYYTRYPWNLFGGVGSGICERWYWYTDDMILARVSHEDIRNAYIEIKK